jgi:hypothetical protein
MKQALLALAGCGQAAKPPARAAAAPTAKNVRSKQRRATRFATFAAADSGVMQPPLRKVQMESYEWNVPSGGCSE